MPEMTQHQPNRLLLISVTLFLWNMATHNGKTRPQLLALMLLPWVSWLVSPTVFNLMEYGDQEHLTSIQTDQSSELLEKMLESMSAMRILNALPLISRPLELVKRIAGHSGLRVLTLLSDRILMDQMSSKTDSSGWPTKELPVEPIPSELTSLDTTTARSTNKFHATPPNLLDWTLLPRAAQYASQPLPGNRDERFEPTYWKIEYRF